MRKKDVGDLCPEERAALHPLVAARTAAARKPAHPRVLRKAAPGPRGRRRPRARARRRGRREEGPERRPADPRPPVPPAPGRPGRADYEYERRGTANLFLFCAPLAGRRWVAATERRTAVDWAHQIKDLLD